MVGEIRIPLAGQRFAIASRLFAYRYPGVRCEKSDPAPAMYRGGPRSLVDTGASRDDCRHPVCSLPIKWGKSSLVYSRRGDVERRALIREGEEGWLCGTGCLRVRFGSGIIDPLYASFYLGHPDVRAWIVRHAIGATMPNLNTGILSALPFVLPPLDEQRAIASVLGALDDKIELNRRMNATLEAMARALFTSWFVDFDPVRAKSEGRTPYGMDAATASLFPATFTDSPLGPIPAGWRVAPLPNVVAVNPPRTLRKGETATYLDMKNMPTSGHRASDWTNRAFGSGMKFNNGDTLLVGHAANGWQ